MTSRATSQKQLIKEEIGKMRSFFNAEKLFEKVSAKNPGIGIATVYRYLKKAVAKGEIHSYTCDRKTIYTVEIKNHCHFTCEVCGSKKHVDLKKLDFIREVLEEEICHFQLDISGICKRCSRN